VRGIEPGLSASFWLTPTRLFKQQRKKLLAAASACHRSEEKIAPSGALPAGLKRSVPMEIRRYKPGEESEIWSVYYGSTRSIISRDYTEAQVARWAPDDKCMKEWRSRITDRNPFVAVIDERIVGFAELESDGHIDYFYCHKDFQGQGIGSALMKRIEEQAREDGIESVYAEVSVTAFPFFSAKGFEVTDERENIVCEAPAKQYLMRKLLKAK
jgi:ribosomal protein S18 acetylase RimI-like enzyme